MQKYDVVVIGSGPAGEKAAVKAAYFKLKVAIVERASSLGGTPVYEGIPAKVLRDVAFHLSGKTEENLYGSFAKTRQDIPIEFFMRRSEELSGQHAKDVKANLKQHGVDIYLGEAAFDDPHHIHIFGQRECVIYGEHVIIAVGTQATPHSSEVVAIDGKRVHNSRTILGISQVPRSICIFGMGIIGCEYSSIFSVLGSKVFFVNRSRRVLPLFDAEATDYFFREYQERGVELLLDEEAVGIKLPKDSEEDLGIVLKSETILHVDMVMYAAGRMGNTKNLRLEKVGVAVNPNGNIPCNENYQTNIEHIYAVGDVNGMIALANAAMDQGRSAVAHILKNGNAAKEQMVIPYGMYTVPEMARVGMKEEELRDKQVDYGVGYSYYGDIPRGKLVGSTGFMKMLFTKSDRVIQGVHIVGPLATELIHYGTELIGGKKTLLFVANQLFNFPTLHELYKYAAYDGLSVLQGYKMKKSCVQSSSEG